MTLFPRLALSEELNRNRYPKRREQSNNLLGKEGAEVAKEKKGRFYTNTLGNDTNDDKAHTHRGLTTHQCPFKVATSYWFHPTMPAEHPHDDYYLSGLGDQRKK